MEKVQKINQKINKTQQDIIKDASTSLSTLSDRGVREDLLILMLHDVTGVDKRQIQLILKALPKLQSTYLKG